MSERDRRSITAVQVALAAVQTAALAVLMTGTVYFQLPLRFFPSLHNLRLRCIEGLAEHHSVGGACMISTGIAVTSQYHFYSANFFPLPISFFLTFFYSPTSDTNLIYLLFSRVTVNIVTIYLYAIGRAAS